MEKSLGGHIFMRGPYPRDAFDVYIWLGKLVVGHGSPWPYAGETRYTLQPVYGLEDNFYLPAHSALALPQFNGYRHDQVLSAPPLMVVWGRRLAGLD